MRNAARHQTERIEVTPGDDGSYQDPRPGNVLVIAYFAVMAAVQMWTGWTIATDKGPD